MRYLFIDTETTGMPKNKFRSPMDVDNWPRLVSVAYIVCDSREVFDKGYFVIKPNGYIIPAESTKVHGITTAEAIERGESINQVLDLIKTKLDSTDYLVGHNIEFDVNVLNAEFYRYNQTLPMNLKPSFCTMLLSKDFCKLPNNKYPTLEELFFTLTGSVLQNAHNAMADTEATMQCFWILKDSGIIHSSPKTPIKIYPTRDNLLWAVDNISMDYAKKSYACLAIACNMKYNEDFLYPKDRFALPNYRTIDRPTHYNDDFSMTEYSDEEWIGGCFLAYNKLLKSEKPGRLIQEAIDEFESEVGCEGIVSQFGINEPICRTESIVLMSDNLWTIIAFNVSYRNLQFAYDNSCYNIFKTIVEQINQKRTHLYYEEERKREESRQRLAKQMGVDLSNEKPLFRKTVQEILEEADKQKASQNNGCMIVLPLLFGILSSVFLFVHILSRTYLRF